MIRKAQIKFICIVMSILLVVFAVIFGATYFIVRNVSERHAEEVLEDTLTTFIDSGKVTVLPNGLIVTLNKDGNPEEFCFDKNIFNEKKISQIVNFVVNHSYTYGQTGTVYYKIKTVDNAKFIVASDVTQSIVMLKSNVVNALIILLTIYFILFLIVSTLSFNVFQPIKDAFEKQKRFVSDASHELKTPIAVISANADVLKQNGDNQWIDNIKSQTARLDGLVADMLTLAKMEENKIILKKEKFNLSQEILNTVLPFDAVAFEKNKNLNVDVEPNILINGDKQSVKNITTILVDNAIKYCSENGKIEVSLRKSGNKAVLTVWNTGSNVPEAEAHRIFERFYRGENSRSRESGGSGLGLSIAKSFAEKNKWKMTAESSLNEYMKISLIIQEKHS